MKIIFIGATRMVAGSCHLIQTKDINILIDCGLFQGTKDDEKKNEKAFPFNTSEIQCLLLTHAHLDNTGLIPKLVKKVLQTKY